MNLNHSQKLSCCIQNYAWGQSGDSAYLNKLIGQVKDPSPKAELWMGAHPKAPSKIGEQSLNDLIQTHGEAILGKASIEKWGKTLPYLFKVLSANEALSIQLHPNKKEAEELHAKDPKNYPDDNHKPEIAIALDQLEALVGFEAFPDLVEQLKLYPEIIDFMGENLYLDLEQALTNQNEEEQLKALKKAFMELNLKALSNKSDLKQLNEQLYERLKQLKNPTPKESWYLELYPKYSDGDVGLFVLFFLNYQVLKAGEAVFLKADVPHAYLKGNIIECMANSDNVVRAGLTPKFVDVETLAKITQYELNPLPVQKGKDNHSGGLVFKTPVPEFEVHFFKSGTEEQDVNFESWSGATIGVVLEGNIVFENEDVIYQKGEVFLIPDCACLKGKLNPNSQVSLAKPNL